MTSFYDFVLSLQVNFCACGEVALKIGISSQALLTCVSISNADVVKRFGWGWIILESGAIYKGFGVGVRQSLTRASHQADPQDGSREI